MAAGALISTLTLIGAQTAVKSGVLVLRRAPEHVADADEPAEIGHTVHSAPLPRFTYSVAWMPRPVTRLA